jgi:starch-binding outer membrane protein, SusD/RagB family
MILQKSIKRHCQTLVIVILLIMFFFSCKKIDNWLDVKRSLTDVRPSTLRDFQAIFDNVGEFNEALPQFGFIGTDNIFIQDSRYSSLAAPQQNAYKWAADIFESNSPSSWADPYSIVAFSNIVLEGMDALGSSTGSKQEIDNVLGQAFFHRGFAFYNLAQLFCKPYNKATAPTDLGIPIRLSSDVNIPSVRSTVEKTYTQILEDVTKAVALLPVTQQFKTRPSKTAAKFLLAKVYLVMEDYEKAGAAAADALSEYSALMDFTSLMINNNPNPTGNPFPAILNNPELIFYGLGQGGNAVAPIRNNNYVDTTLYALYAANDLRKGFFFRLDTKYFLFKGSYDLTNNKCFAGFATNELYLIRAECYARNGRITEAFADLNTLLSKRFRSPFIPIAPPANSDSALAVILRERRKELVYTGQIRWEDLRRLNKDPRFAVVIKRILNGTTYQLLPNDDKYVFPIPDVEVQQYGLQQNPR